MAVLTPYVSPAFIEGQRGAWSYLDRMLSGKQRLEQIAKEAEQQRQTQAARIQAETGAVGERERARLGAEGEYLAPHLQAVLQGNPDLAKFSGMTEQVQVPATPAMEGPGTEPSAPATVPKRQLSPQEAYGLAKSPALANYYELQRQEALKRTEMGLNIEQRKQIGEWMSSLFDPSTVTDPQQKQTMTFLQQALKSGDQKLIEQVMPFMMWKMLEGGGAPGGQTAMFPSIGPGGFQLRPMMPRTDRDSVAMQVTQGDPGGPKMYFQLSKDQKERVDKSLQGFEGGLSGAKAGAATQSRLDTMAGELNALKSIAGAQAAGRVTGGAEAIDSLPITHPKSGYRGRVVYDTNTWQRVQKGTVGDVEKKIEGGEYGVADNRMDATTVDTGTRGIKDIESLEKYLDKVLASSKTPFANLGAALAYGAQRGMGPTFDQGAWEFLTHQLPMYLGRAEAGGVMGMATIATNFSSKQVPGMGNTQYGIPVSISTPWGNLKLGVDVPNLALESVESARAKLQGAKVTLDNLRRGITGGAMREPFTSGGPGPAGRAPGQGNVESTKPGSAYVFDPKTGKMVPYR